MSPLLYLATETPLDTVVSAMESTFTPAALATVIAAVIGGAAGLALAYFGMRKAISVMWRAFSRGKLRV